MEEGLLERIRATHSWGVTAEVRPVTTPISSEESIGVALNKLVIDIGLPIPDGPPNYWYPLSRARAVERLAELLGVTIAYSARVLPETVGLRLAREFVASFAPDARCFATFSEWESPGVDGGRSKGGSPLTDSTMDEAIAVIDQHRAGIVVVEDED